MYLVGTKLNLTHNLMNAYMSITDDDSVPINAAMGYYRGIERLNITLGRKGHFGM